MYVYFFSGALYTLLNRQETGPGSIVAGFNPPRPISDWGWPTLPNSPARFGADGIDAALYSGSKSYFFKGPYYVSVTRTETTGFGTQDFEEAHPISDWKFCNGFGAEGIDSALWSGPVTYFFKGNEYIRVTRGEADVGNGCDPGYPKTIAGGWGWPAPFTNLVKAALPSGLVDYFFSGNDYIRVNRGLELAGYVNAGYPGTDAHDSWRFPAGFATNGPDAALYSGGELAPYPSGGLQANSNYWVGSGGADLTGLTATVTIDDDLISTVDGFGFQLNTMSQAIPSQLTALVQQLIIYSPRGTNQLIGRIEIFCSSGGASITPIQDSLVEEVSLGTLPAVNTMKAGSSVTITALTDPTTKKLTGCQYTYNPAGGAAMTGTINIADGTVPQTGQKATAGYMQPIDAATMNIVADYSFKNGAQGVATFTGGQGTISWGAAQPLTAYSGTPAYSNIWSVTEEVANTAYAALPGGRPFDLSQLWGTTPPVPLDATTINTHDALRNQTIIVHRSSPPVLSLAKRRHARDIQF